MKLNPHTILAVDDEPDILGELSIFLSRKGIKVVTAANGRDALDLFRREKPLVTITDFKMPGMDGLELLHQIKLVTRNAQVMFISGKADIQTAVRAMKDDAFDFLFKPVDLNEVWEKVRAVTSREIRAFSENENQAQKKRYECLSVEMFTMDKPVAAIHIHVPLDEFTAGKIQENFRDLLRDPGFPRHLAFMLKRVPYINNVGLNLLIDLHDRLRQKGFHILLCELSEPVQKYFGMLGYNQYFPIENTLNQAVNELGHME